MSSCPYLLGFPGIVHCSTISPGTTCFLIFDLSEAPRPQAGASRARSGERDASKGIFVHIVPFDRHTGWDLRGTFRSEVYRCVFLNPLRAAWERDHLSWRSYQDILNSDATRELPSPLKGLTSVAFHCIRSYSLHPQPFQACYK